VFVDAPEILSAVLAHWLKEHEVMLRQTVLCVGEQPIDDDSDPLSGFRVSDSKLMSATAGGAEPRVALVPLSRCVNNHQQDGMTAGFQDDHGGPSLVVVFSRPTPYHLADSMIYDGPGSWRDRHGWEIEPCGFLHVLVGAQGEAVPAGPTWEDCRVTARDGKVDSVECVGLWSGGPNLWELSSQSRPIHGDALEAAKATVNLDDCYGALRGR
jgi:hypothetical protein